MRVGLFSLLWHLLIQQQPSAATTALIDFDRLPISVAGETQRPIGGLLWSNFGIVAASDAAGPAGLIEGVVSTPNVAFNLDPSLPSTISGHPFGLVDGWFSSWQDDALQISVAGFGLKGEQLYSSTFTVDTLGPVPEAFNWQGLSSVVITSSSTIGQPSFSVDDVRLVLPISEPRSILALLLGVVCLGFSPASKGQQR